VAIKYMTPHPPIKFLRMKAHRGPANQLQDNCDDGPRPWIQIAKSLFPPDALKIDREMLRRAPTSNDPCSASADSVTDTFRRNGIHKRIGPTNLIVI
jgi:hypothetical protein